MGNSISCVNERSTKSRSTSRSSAGHQHYGKECINRTVPSGETLLTIAACNGDLQLANQLIAQGARVDQQNSSGNTSLHIAIRARHDHIVDFLLDCGADVNARDRSGLTPLHLACVHRNSSVVQKLLDAGSFPNGIMDNKFYVSTPLMAAVENGDLNMAEILLQCGAEVDKKDWWMNTALLKAVQVGSVDLVQLLLRHGADPNVENRFGGTALHYSTIADHCQITKLLINSGCSLKVKTMNHSKNCSKKAIERYPPLAASIHRACYTCFKFFLEQGVDVNENINCKNCKTPLLYAVTNRAWDCHDQHLRSTPQCNHSETPISVDSTRLNFATDLIERGTFLRPVWEGVVWQMRSMYITTADCDALSLLIRAMGFIHLENFKVETFYRTMVLSRQWNAVWLLYCAGFHVNEECRSLANKMRATGHGSTAHTISLFGGALRDNQVSAATIGRYLAYAGIEDSISNGEASSVSITRSLQWLDFWLDEVLPNPRSLRNICVIKIREHLPENVFFFAKKLNLPKSLYDMVTLTSYSMP